MKPFLALTIFIAAAATCHAYEPGEFAAEYHALDRVAGAALRSPAELPRVVAVLASVLLGKPSETIGDFNQLTGLGPGGIARLHLAETESRCYAAEKLGETGSQSALEILSAFRLADAAASDQPYYLLGCVTVGEKEIREHAAGDNVEEKIRLARGVLNEHSYGGNVEDTVYRWAINRLCDLGSSSDFPLIESSMNAIHNDWWGKSELEFCRDRIAVVARDPDRTKALSTVLLPAGHGEDSRIHGWAIYQLLAMHSADGDRALARYFAEVDKLDRDNPLHYEAVWQAQDVNEAWKAYGRHY
jgi:hypothetical protein